MIPRDFMSQELIEKLKNEDDGYHVYDIFATPKGNPVLIQMSNRAEPAHWRVIDKTCNAFFLSFAEVQDYIRRRGLMPGKTYAQTHNDWRF